MVFIIDLCLEPPIDALRVENMSAYRYLPNKGTLLEILKADDTLCQFELIDLFVIALFFDKAYQLIHPLFVCLAHLLY